MVEHYNMLVEIQFESVNRSNPLKTLEMENQTYEYQGKFYKRVPEIHTNSCQNCAFTPSTCTPFKLKHSIQGCSLMKAIFVEVKQEKEVTRIILARNDECELTAKAQLEILIGVKDRIKSGYHKYICNAVHDVTGLRGGIAKQLSLFNMHNARHFGAVGSGELNVEWFPGNREGRREYIDWMIEETAKQVPPKCLEHLPQIILDRIMECQVEQGNEPDLRIFETVRITAAKYEKGFNWDATTEGRALWDKVLIDKNQGYFVELQKLLEAKKNPPVPANNDTALTNTSDNTEKVSPYPCVMMVSDDGNRWLKRVVIMEAKGKFFAWSGAETLEDAEKITTITSWNYAKPVEEPKPEPKVYELSMQEIADKFNIPIETLRVRE